MGQIFTRLLEGRFWKGAEAQGHNGTKEEGFKVLWFYGLMVLRHYGVKVLGCYGVTVLRHLEIRFCAL